MDNQEHSDDSEWMQLVMANLQFPDDWPTMTMIQQNYWIETQISLQRVQARQTELCDLDRKHNEQRARISQRRWLQCML